MDTIIISKNGHGTTFTRRLIVISVKIEDFLLLVQGSRRRCRKGLGHWKLGLVVHSMSLKTSCFRFRDYLDLLNSRLSSYYT